MLGKLLKYEIPAMGRRLLPLYGAWAATALFLGIATQSSASKSDFMAVMSILLYVAIAVSILVMSVVLIVQRYSRSLLGDEAYFNLTLPVSTAAHIGNKLISATLWIAVTAVAALLTGFLILVGIGLTTRFEGFDLGYINIPKGFWLNFIVFVILAIASVVKSVMQIYAAVTIGHQAQNHTTLASIGAYIGVLIFEGTAARVITGIFPVFRMTLGSQSSAAMQQLYGMEGFLDLTQIFIPALMATAAFSAIYFFICMYLMEKKLDLA